MLPCPFFRVALFLKILLPSLPQFLTHALLLQGCSHLKFAGWDINEAVAELPGDLPQWLTAVAGQDLSFELAAKAITQRHGCLHLRQCEVVK